MKRVGIGIVLQLVAFMVFAQAGEAPSEPLPKVDLFSPQGEMRDVRQATARFSVPMVALGDPRLADPFGVTGAAPVWRELMIELHRDEASLAPEPPANVIPTAYQKLPISTEGATRAMTLKLNGHELARADHVTLWTPQEGAYALELGDEHGKVLDRVVFTVR